MKKVLSYQKAEESFPIPEGRILIEEEEDIWNFLISLRSVVDGIEGVPPVAITINSETNVLVFRGTWEGPKELEINPFTGKKYRFFLRNAITNKLIAPIPFGTGRVIGLLPNAE